MCCYRSRLIFDEVKAYKKIVPFILGHPVHYWPLTSVQGLSDWHPIMGPLDQGAQEINVWGPFSFIMYIVSRVVVMCRDVSLRL